jgi:hypothetical protein
MGCDDAVKDRKGEYLEASANFVAVRILNLNTGETYTGRLAITGNHQIYVPAEIQKMLEDAERIRIQLP